MRRRGPPGRRCRSQPGRGGMADPEAYDFTSIQERIRCRYRRHDTAAPVTFLPFVGSPRQDMPRTELNHSRRFTIRPSLRDGFDLTKAKPSRSLKFGSLQPKKSIFFAEATKIIHTLPQFVGCLSKVGLLSQLLQMLRAAKGIMVSCIGDFLQFAAELLPVIERLQFVHVCVPLDRTIRSVLEPAKLLNWSQISPSTGNALVEPTRRMPIPCGINGSDTAQPVRGYPNNTKGSLTDENNPHFRRSIHRSLRLLSLCRTGEYWMWSRLYGL